MRRIGILALGLALMGLAGCTGGSRDQTLAAALAGLGLERLQSLRPGNQPPARPPVTRAVLDTLDGAFLEATLDRSDTLAYLFVNAERRDSGPGEVIVWRTDDNNTLALRNGVLIATRGLRGDLLSTTTMLQGDIPGPVSGGERIYEVRIPGNRSAQLVLACALEDLGPETIVIVEQAHRTRHLRERCEGDGGIVVNDYWTDTDAGLVWQSRQWAGPEIGYIRMRQLTQ